MIKFLKDIRTRLKNYISHMWSRLLMGMVMAMFSSSFVEIIIAPTRTKDSIEREGSKDS